MALPDKSISQRTALAGVGEVTVVTLDANAKNAITSIVITTPNAAAGTLTLRDSTAGTTRAILDYPNAASAPTTPFTVTFDPPLSPDARNANWTLQASVNASGYNVLVSFVKQ